MRRWVVIVSVTLVGLPLVPSAAAPAGGMAGEIAFLSTLPSWPPPENLDAARLYSVGVAGQSRLRLDAKAGTDDGDALVSLSPDRRLVAVVRNYARYGPTSNGVWLLNAAGSGERRLLAEQPQESFFEGGLAAPAWSPDGRLLAVSAVSAASCGPGDQQCATWYVVVVDLRGRRVVTIDDASNASWAPDGKRLVVEHGNLSLSPELATIDVVRLSAPEAFRTVSGRIRHTDRYSGFRSPSWSPDGRTITFAEGDSVMHVVAAADGRRLWSGSGVFAGWSRDGSKLLFSGSSDAVPVYVVGRDGHGLRRLTSRSSGSAAWSRDGRHVLFVGADKGKPLYSVGADGRGQRRLVAATGGSFVVAPTGPLVAFTLRNGRDLGVVAATGGSVRVVSGQPEQWRVSPFGWSADGKRVLFEGSSPTLSRLALWVMRADGSSGRLLARAAVAGSEPSSLWSPDGRWLAYRTDTGLYVVGRGGTGRQRVTGGTVASFEWAPDSARLAYARGPTGDALGSVRLVRRDGTGERVLVSAAEAPSWSPDGAWIAYLTPSGPTLRVVRPDGTGDRLLVAETASLPEESLPAWSPDSRWIAFASARRGIDAVSVDGATTRTLVPRPTEADWLAAPVWSPDGSRLAFVQRDNRLDRLGVARTDGTGSRLVADVEYRYSPGRDAWQPSWSPDGASVLYVARDAGGRTPTFVYAVPADGGEPVRLTTFNAVCSTPAWAPAPR